MKSNVTKVAAEGQNSGSDPDSALKSIGSDGPQGTAGESLGQGVETEAVSGEFRGELRQSSQASSSPPDTMETVEFGTGLSAELAEALEDAISLDGQLELCSADWTLILDEGNTDTLFEGAPGRGEGAYRTVSLEDSREISFDDAPQAIFDGIDGLEW